MTQPLFIKIEEYEELAAIVENIRQKIQESRLKLHEIKDLRAKEEQGLQAWDESMMKVSDRLDKIGRHLN